MLLLHDSITMLGCDIYELHQSIWVTVVARASRFRYSVELPALRDSLHHTFS